MGPMFYLYKNKSVNKFPYSTHLRQNYLYSEKVNKNPVKLSLLLHLKKLALLGKKKTQKPKIVSKVP